MQRFAANWHKQGVSTQTSDAELLVRSRTSVEAFGVIYTRHALAVHRYLSSRAGSATAEDLLGEVFTVAVEARLRVKPRTSGSASFQHLADWPPERPVCEVAMSHALRRTHAATATTHSGSSMNPMNPSGPSGASTPTTMDATASHFGRAWVARPASPVPT